MKLELEIEGRTALRLANKNMSHRQLGEWLSRLLDDDESDGVFSRDHHACECGRASTICERCSHDSFDDERRELEREHDDELRELREELEDKDKNAEPAEEEIANLSCEIARLRAAIIQENGARLKAEAFAKTQQEERERVFRRCAELEERAKQALHAHPVKEVGRIMAVHLKKALKIVDYAISSDTTRPNVNCATIDKTRVFATDGHRVAIAPIDAGFVITLPAWVCSLLSKADGEIAFTREGERCGASFNGRSLSWVDVDFVPPVDQVLPQGIARATYSTSKKDMPKIEGRELFAKPCYAILEGAGARMQREPRENGSILLSAVVAVNYRYFVEAVKAVGKARDLVYVEIALAGKNNEHLAPISIVGPNGVAVVMPVRT